MAQQHVRGSFAPSRIRETASQATLRADPSRGPRRSSVAPNVPAAVRFGHRLDAIAVHGRDEGKPVQRTRGSGVVQRFGLLDTLIEFVKDHPGAAIATAAAGLIAYYAWRRQPRQAQQQPQQQQPPPPDFTTLAGVAAAVGVQPNVLEQQLETGIGNVNVQALLAHDAFTAGQTRATGLVPPSMLANLPAGDPGKMDTLFQRLNALPFAYEGRNYGVEIGFLQHVGDCATLVLMLEYAAEAAHVAGVAQGHDGTPMLVESRAIHGRAATSNTAGEPYWYFDNHHWIAYGGQRYDVLFKLKGTPATHHRSGNGVHRGVAYEIFNNGAALIPRDHVAAKLKTALADDREGYAARSEDAVKAYIDQDIKPAEEVKL